MRDAAQHVAAQELAVDVDELRVRADRAGAGHAVRLQESPGQGSLKTYSGTRQPSEKGPNIRGDTYAGKFMRRIRLWKRGSGLKSSKQGSTFSKTIHSACCWYAVSSH